MESKIRGISRRVTSELKFEVEVNPQRFVPMKGVRINAALGLATLEIAPCMGLDGKTMLLESLNALILAGNDALQTTCGLSVERHHVSLIREGSLTFPGVGELRFKNAPLQTVHLGCDSMLCAQLASLVGGAADETGIATLANRFLSQLVEEMEGRNPRGSVHYLEVGPKNLVSRGLRSFGFRLETEVGQLYVLAEVPSRMEMETAKGSDYLHAMEATYLPREWGNRQTIGGQLAVENFLVFLRKVEGDTVFEVPGDGDVNYVHAGILLDNGTFNGVRGLKFCTDLSQATQEGLKAGDMVRATVGIRDRSLQFELPYLGEASHSMVNGVELPCAFFQPPQAVNITQRRLAFRIPVAAAVPVEVHCGDGANEASPWADGELPTNVLLSGTLADLSFSGARIVVGDMADVPCLEINRRVIIDMHFPDLPEPLSVLSVVRRSTSRLADRNERQQELGLEFLISQDTDRAALDHIRQFVLAEQRSRLAHRIHAAGVPS